MNVLHLIPSMHPDAGGTSQGIRNIIPGLEQLGITNEVVCIDDPAEVFLAKDKFKITALGPSKGPWQSSDKLIPWLVENIGRFDVVIINALWLYHGYAFRKALRQYKKLHSAEGSQLHAPKFYVMPHGMLDPYFQKAADRKIKAIRNWVYWKLIESKLVNEADGLLFTCESELRLAREPFSPYHPKREINIGYGTDAPPVCAPDMSEAFLEKCPEVAGQPFLLFLSRIHEKKGVIHLIEAFEKIIAMQPAFPKLVIAGPGLETAYGKKMQQLVNSSKVLQQSVFFPGMLTGNAKWGAFYGAEAFILPSHQENFGIAVVEALACGKPVLISKQVNIWHEIIEGGGGLVEDDTTAGTLRLLESWQRLSKNEKEAMSTNAQTVFQKHFKIETAAERFKEALISR